MPSENDNLDAIRVRMDGIIDKLESGFKTLHRAIEEQNTISDGIAARLLAVELGEAGCRAVRHEFRETSALVAKIREDMAASKARIGFIVTGASLIASAVVAMLVKYLGG